MGGFAVDTHELDNVIERLTITPSGVFFLLRNGLHCPISTEDIEDKSKADAFTKLLVCVQVLWLLGEVIERKVAGLPLSILELHTLVHVLCALLMYCLWFQKPHNIHVPTLIDLSRHQSLLAVLVESNSICTQRHRPWSDDSPGRFFDSLHTNPNDQLGFRLSLPGRPARPWHPTALIYDTSDHQAEMDHERAPSMMSTAEDEHLLQQSSSLDNLPEFRLESVNALVAVCLLPGERLGRVGFEVPKGDVTKTISNGHRYGYQTLLSRKDVRRYRLIDQIWDHLLVDRSTTAQLQMRGDNFMPIEAKIDSRRRLTTKRQSNMRGVKPIADNSTQQNMWVLLQFAFLPGVYGAVHLAAWTSHFATSSEQTLWRISGIVVASIAVPCIALSVHVEMGNPLTRDTKKNGTRRRNFKRFLGDSLLAISMIYALLYVAARIFIVIESFISLRSMPAGVFVLPERNIMDNIPHL
jgi:hypothetical protein